jgi:hypothetical protein
MRMLIQLALGCGKGEGGFDGDISVFMRFMQSGVVFECLG